MSPEHLVRAMHRKEALKQAGFRSASGGAPIDWHQRILGLIFSCPKYRYNRPSVEQRTVFRISDSGLEGLRIQITQKSRIGEEFS